VAQSCGPIEFEITGLGPIPNGTLISRCLPPSPHTVRNSALTVGLKTCKGHKEGTHEYSFET